MKFPANHSVIGVAPSSSGKTLVYQMLSRLIEILVSVMTVIYGDSLRTQGALLSGKTVKYRFCGEQHTFVRSSSYTVVFYLRPIAMGFMIVMQKTTEAAATYLQQTPNHALYVTSDELNDVTDMGGGNASYVSAFLHKIFQGKFSCQETKGVCTSSCS